MKTICIRCFLFSFFLLSLPLFPADADDVQALFARAYDLLDSGEYREANRLFSDLCTSCPDHKNAAMHLFFKAKCRYYAELYDESISDFNYLIGEYPDSRYVPYSYFFLGNSYHRMDQSDMAIGAYLNSYVISSDGRLDEIVLASIESEVAVFGKVIVEKISAASIPESRMCALLVSVARALLRQGDFQLVESMLSSCRSTEAKRLIEQADRYVRGQIEIGVVLPLSGEFQKYGEQLLDGIMLMVDEFRSETGGRITPLLYDTRGENLEAARIIRRLAMESVTAAVGPLTSEETAVASAVLSCGDLPLIVPAASQGGLTELSQTCFQLQPNLDWQGIRMADFAVESLKADTAAIITPTSPENLRMAKAFKKRFEELGGFVLGIEYFRVKETDFGPYVRDVKSLIVGDLLDSITFIDEVGDTIEAEEVPVWLDCLYIPANSNQLRQLLPQIHFYNLNTVYLGGDGWGSSTIYDLGESITRKCYFSSGMINDEGNISQQFAIDFDRKYGRQPGRLEALGYDAMALICHALRTGNYSRAEIRQYLLTVADFNGVAGVVTFGKNRENIELPIYTIEEGKPKRVTF